MMDKEGTDPLNCIYRAKLIPCKHLTFLKRFDAVGDKLKVCGLCLQGQQLDELEKMEKDMYSL